MTTYAAVLLSVSMVAGQAEPASSPAIPQQVLDQFGAMVGDWVLTARLRDGGTVEAAMTVRWAPGQHMLVWDCSWSSPGVNTRGTGIFGWEPLEEQVHMSEFWTNGVFHHRHFKVTSDKKWEGKEFSGVYMNLKPLRQKISIEFVEPNKVVLKTWDSEVDGEKLEGSFELTMTRK